MLSISVVTGTRLRTFFWLLLLKGRVGSARLKLPQRVFFPPHLKIYIWLAIFITAHKLLIALMGAKMEFSHRDRLYEFVQVV